MIRNNPLSDQTRANLYRTMLLPIPLIKVGDRFYQVSVVTEKPNKNIELRKNENVA